MLDCYKEGDKVKIPRMLREIGHGGNGTVFECDIINYSGRKLLACKKEHKVCLWYVYTWDYIYQWRIDMIKALLKFVNVNCLFSNAKTKI